jgi:hypothetical protein
VLHLAWSAASPLFGAPDEGAHVIRAAAIARGQLAGTDVLSAYGWESRVRVPASFEQMARQAGCFVFQPAVTPRCVSRAPLERRIRPAPTAMGRYPPLYYLIVAPVTRISTTRPGVYLMRVLGAIVCAAFLASALASAQLLGAWAVVGVAAAITPMVLYFGAVVNANGLEIAGAVCLWATMTAIARGPGPEPRLVAVATIAFVVLANTRGLSLPMAIVAVVAPLLTATRERVVEIIASRAARIGGGVALAGTVAAVVWIGFVGRIPQDKNVPTHFTIGEGLGRTWRIFEESIAWFGNSEARDLASIVIWAAVWGLLLLVALRIGSIRDGLVLVGVVLLAIAVPIAVSLAHPAPVFTTWYGRYGLALWVGLPVLAGGIVSSSPPRHTGLAVGAIATGLAYGHISAFATAAHRYVVGSGGPRLYFLHPVWSGIVPPVVLLVVVSLAYAAFAAAVARRPARPGCVP